MFHLFCVKLQNVYVYVHFDIQVSKSLDTQIYISTLISKIQDYLLVPTVFTVKHLLWNCDFWCCYW